MFFSGYLQASSMAWYPHKYPRKDYHTSFRNERYCCPKCLKSYSSKSAVTSHYKYDCDKPPRFQCPYCGKLSKKKFNVQDHIKRKHPTQPITCNILPE